MATFIPVEGESKTVHNTRGHFTLSEMQGFVGGYIEMLPLNGGEYDGQFMILNEEGKVHNLPYNPTATAIFQLHVLGHIPGDYIAGPVLICTSEEAGMEEDED